MDFIYIAGGPQGPHEQRVAAAGYKWVRTNALAPTQAHRPLDPARPDRLLAHSHHGENTHLIVEGDLTITEARGRGERRSEISTAPGAAEEKPVAPGVAYKGATRCGCRFVEGHRRLSPASAERYVARGTLRAAAGGGGGGSCALLPSEEKVRRWLRGARFRPGGKAQARPWLGEAPVLAYAEAPASEAEAKAQLEIARWFEREWRGAGAPAGLEATDRLLILGILVLVARVFYVYLRGRLGQAGGEFGVSLLGGNT